MFKAGNDYSRELITVVVNPIRTTIYLLCLAAVTACATVAPLSTPADRPGVDDAALSGVTLTPLMDAQEAEFRECLNNSGVSVMRNGDRITLNMPGHITFAIDSDRIRPAFHDVLDAIVLVVKRYDDTHLEVIGHTDSVGSEAYNQTLSQNRARVVAQYMAARGIAPSRLMVAGMGERQPIASNDSPEGRSRNRRVELRITPAAK